MSCVPFAEKDVSVSVAARDETVFWPAHGKSECRRECPKGEETAQRREGKEKEKARPRVRCVVGTVSMQFARADESGCQGRKGRRREFLEVA